MKLSRVDVSAYSNNAVRKPDGRFYMAHEVEAEIDALKAENAILRGQVDTMSATCVILDQRRQKAEAENERLRKDAERYHVVRHCDARVLRHISEIDGFDKFDARVDEVLINEAMDWGVYRARYIDAAMSALPDTKGE